MSTSPLAVIPALSKSQWELMLEQANVLIDSGLLPADIRKPAQAVAIMLKGQELGIKPMYALSNIVIVKGKPSASAELMLALIFTDHGDSAFRWLESTDQVATASYKRRTDTARQEFSFTWEDALKAGLTGGDNWRKYPKAMLRARCVSAIARMYFPDSIGGMYTPEELGLHTEYEEDGALSAASVPASVFDGVRIVGEPSPVELEPGDSAGDLFSAPIEAVEGEIVQGNARAAAAPKVAGGEQYVASEKKLSEQLRDARQMMHPEGSGGSEEADVSAELDSTMDSLLPDTAPEQTVWEKTEPLIRKRLTVKLGCAPALVEKVIAAIAADLQHWGKQDDRTAVNDLWHEVKSWNVTADVTLWLGRIEAAV